MVGIVCTTDVVVDWGGARTGDFAGSSRTGGTNRLCCGRCTYSWSRKRCWNLSPHKCCMNRLSDNRYINISQWLGRRMSLCFQTVFHAIHPPNTWTSRTKNVWKFDMQKTDREGACGGDRTGWQTCLEILLVFLLSAFLLVLTGLAGNGLHSRKHHMISKDVQHVIWYTTTGIYRRATPEGDLKFTWSCKCSYVLSRVLMTRAKYEHSGQHWTGPWKKCPSLSSCLYSWIPTGLGMNTV